MFKNNYLRPSLFVALVLAGFAGQAAQAASIIVGTCKPGIQFATIGAAITAAPGGATVNVCPGIYPEQVTIDKDLVLKGIVSGNSGAAIITSPPGGLVPNANKLGGAGVEAQVYVHDATVTISTLTMDAANSNLDSLGCDGNPVGIFFKNASGVITRNSVRNDVLSLALNGCEGGLGIYAASASSSDTVQITFNSVENYQKNGITVNGPGTGGGPTGTISSNTVIGQGPTSGAAENSIQVGFGATGTIASNTVGSDVWAPDVFGDVGNAAAGILVYAAPNVIVKSNNVSQTQYGIAIVTDSNFGSADNAQVTSNTVSTTHLYDGIDLCSNSNVATLNTVNGSDEAAVHVDATCSSTGNNNTVNGNKINSACAGILVGPGTSGNNIGTNTYYNTVTLKMTGSDTCTPAPIRSGKLSQARSHGKFSPAR
jgi:hypothetical protein